MQEVHFIEKIVFDEAEKLEERLMELEALHAAMPEGKLVITHNDNRCKWYRSNSKKYQYIPKCEFDLASKLAYKKIIEIEMEMIKQELIIIRKDLRKYNEIKDRYFQIMLDKSFVELLCPFGLNKAVVRNECSNNVDSYEEWMLEDYETNANYPENKIYTTVNNIKVRSKSEVIIAMVLAKYGIAFRYECALDVNGVIFYPDFTIKIPGSGEIKYWEHFGMMDSEEYERNARHKLEMYMREGIYPMEKLILTYETGSEPLDYFAVERIVKKFIMIDEC